jgi:DNA-directed RNA polymerase
MKGRVFDSTMRKLISKLALKQADLDSKNNWIPSWPESTHVKAGSVLSALFMRVAKVVVPITDPENPSKDM